MVPNSIPMVALLGPRDEHLALIRRPSRPTSTCGQPGDLRGDPAEVALVERLFDEMVMIIRTGRA